MNTIYTRASNHGDDIAGLMLVVLGDTDVSRITSDTDPVNWHVVAQDRTTWKSTMLIDVPTNPTTTRTLELEK